ncbi:uncharacterized protein KD926_008220 [Aspergillus affinis]|uniref:uncharacterized protein n=1 Tax=Aspergillus affinis TaxID=1070780 RepID=UPI0022FE25DF|nr:uncharacterized protein KD926_008220 [Aspergillus affinis]KAI9040515.1 hypothetical protein KD926_008220 [Aspergillus affinis]
MDCPSVDPNTRSEVDLMILDYIVCTAISRLLNTREVESVTWSQDIIDTGTAFLLTFQDTESIPDDLRTKLQVFDFMCNFLRYAWPTAQSPSSVEARSFAGHWQVCPKRDDDRGRPAALPEIVTQFTLLCNDAHTQIFGEKQRRIAARLIMQAALEVTTVQERRASENFDQELYKEVDNLITTLIRQVDIDMTNYWSPPMGITLAVQVESSSREMPLLNLQDAMVDFLSNLMEGLEAPVLVQLERGQLQGLSRTETKQLKEKVGFR